MCGYLGYRDKVCVMLIIYSLTARGQIGGWLLWLYLGIFCKLRRHILTWSFGGMGPFNKFGRYGCMTKCYVVVFGPMTKLTMCVSGFGCYQIF